MKNLWIGLYHHRYGVDAFVRFQDNEPTEQQFIDDIRKETDWEDDERVEVRGPWECEGPGRWTREPVERPPCERDEMTDRLAKRCERLSACLDAYDVAVTKFFEVDQPSNTDWLNLRAARNLARVELKEPIVRQKEADDA